MSSSFKDAATTVLKDKLLADSKLQASQLSKGSHMLSETSNTGPEDIHWTNDGSGVDDVENNGNDSKSSLGSIYLSPLQETRKLEDVTERTHRFSAEGARLDDIQEQKMSQNQDDKMASVRVPKDELNDDSMTDDLNHSYCAKNGHDRAELCRWSGHRLNGVILRKHLLCILWQKHRTLHPEDEMPNPNLASDHLKFEKAISDRVLTHYEFERNYPRYPRLDRIFLTPAEEKMWVDLSPYAGLPWAVPTVSPLSRTFQLFRTMGLRHIIVTNAAFCVQGIITRKELTVRWAKKKFRKLGLDDDDDD
jgi:hypothetical protein